MQPAHSINEEKKSVVCVTFAVWNFAELHVSMNTTWKKNYWTGIWKLDIIPGICSDISLKKELKISDRIKVKSTFTINLQDLHFLFIFFKRPARVLVAFKCSHCCRRGLIYIQHEQVNCPLELWWNDTLLLPPPPPPSIFCFVGSSPSGIVASHSFHCCVTISSFVSGDLL